MIDGQNPTFCLSNKSCYLIFSAAMTVTGARIASLWGRSFRAIPVTTRTPSFDRVSVSSGISVLNKKMSWFVSDRGNINALLNCSVDVDRSRLYSDVNAKEVDCCIGNTTDVIPASLSYTVWFSHICCQRRENEDKTEVHRFCGVIEESFLLVVSSA